MYYQPDIVYYYAPAASVALGRFLKKKNTTMLADSVIA